MSEGVVKKALRVARLRLRWLAGPLAARILCRIRGLKMLTPAETRRRYGIGPGAIRLMSSLEAPITVKPFGVVTVGSDVLTLDYGANSIALSFSSDRKLAGTVACLWSQQWMPNYYHWIIDCLPRALSLLNCESAPSPKAYAFPGKLPGPYALQSLQLLGILQDEVVDLRECRGVRADNILLSPLPPMGEVTPLVRSLRERVRDINASGEGGNKRLYVSRSVGRTCLNEDEVRDLLVSRGFFILEDVPRTFAEQVAAFGDAEVVVGVHGAGLTNALWARPNSALVDCQTSAYQTDFFKSLAEVAGLQYFRLLDSTQAASSGFNRQAPLRIDCAQLSLVLDKLGF